MPATRIQEHSVKYPTCHLVKNHSSCHGGACSPPGRSIYGKRHVIAPGASSAASARSSPAPWINPHKRARQVQRAFVYVIRIAARLMSNGTIYRVHAGMLLLWYDNFAACSRTRDRGGDRYLHEGERPETSMKMCRKLEMAYLSIENRLHVLASRRIFNLSTRTLFSGHVFLEKTMRSRVFLREYIHLPI